MRWHSATSPVLHGNRKNNLTPPLHVELQVGYQSSIADYQDEKTTGRKLRVFSCGDGEKSYLSDISYEANSVTVTCARDQMTVNLQTRAPS